MKEYKSGVILALIIVYFLLSFYEMIINENINDELDKQVEYVAYGIEKCFLNKMDSVKNAQEIFYCNPIHGSKDILPELTSVPYENDEKRLVLRSSEAVGILRGYANTLDFITSAYMVLENGEMYVHSKDNNYNVQYKIENDRFEKEDKTYIRILEKGISNERVLLFVRPMYNKNNIHVGSLYFEMPYKKLYDFFSCLNFYVNNFYYTISDINNNVIYSNKNEFIFETDKNFYITVENVENRNDNITNIKIDNYLLKIEVNADEKEVFSDLFAINVYLITFSIFIILYTCAILLLHSPRINCIYVIGIAIFGILLYANLSTLTKNSIDNSRTELVKTFGRLYELYLSGDYENDEMRIKGALNFTVNNETNYTSNLPLSTASILNRFSGYEDVESLIVMAPNFYEIFPNYQKEYISEEKMRTIYNYEYSGEALNKIRIWNEDKYMLTHKIPERDALMIMIITRSSLCKYLDDITVNSIDSIDYTVDNLDFNELYLQIESDVREYERNRKKQDTIEETIQDIMNFNSNITNQIDRTINNIGEIEKDNDIVENNPITKIHLKMAEDIEKMIDKLTKNNVQKFEEDMLNKNKILVRKVMLDKTGLFGIFNKEYTYIMILSADYNYNILEGNVLSFSNKDINFITTVFNTISFFGFLIIIVGFIVMEKHNRKRNNISSNLYKDDRALQDIEQLLEADDDNDDNDLN